MSDWYIEPFDRFIQFIQESDRVLNLSIKGIYQISQQMPLLQALDNLERVRAENADRPFEPKNFEAAKLEAEFARQEIEKEFPLLHSHALVTTWSALEALFEDVVVVHLINRPEILKEEAFQKTRIPLATYEQLNQEDKSRLLVYEVQRTLSSEQRLGLDCFEALLKLVSLSGKVESEMRRDIYEIQQLRHTIVHRASLADRKLLEACPWLKLTSGERIMISREHYRRLIETVFNYVTLVIKRATESETERKKHS
jgi:hypothetical protein